MTNMPDISWNRVSGFVRQHTHDLRNELNGLDLEAALLADIVTDPEARECVDRMRVEIRKVAADLRALSAKFADARPSRMAMSAHELFLIWKDQLSELPGLEVEWEDQLGDEQVNVDPSAVAQSLRELLVNAHSFRASGAAKARAHLNGSSVVFELWEPKVDPVDPSCWGLSPLNSTRHGSYGLGLCTLLRTIEANGGAVLWRFDEKEKALVTTISFPLATES